MKSLITGITGQDGSYLAELLLSKGYEVYGVKRRSSVHNTERIDNLDIQLFDADMTDSLSLLRLIKQIEPDEIYNLAAQSFVQSSFDTPEYTANVDGIGTLRILEAVRILGLNTKIYQASTSELFGRVQQIPQTETTPFYPRSPYGIAKLYAYWIAQNYRESYDMFVCNGILFNHESPRRGEEFVTKKIIKGVVNILNGTQEKLYLGNLNAKRDWGHAKDYVRAMYLALQQKEPRDYVIATGETYSIREFIQKCFECFDLKITFKGNGVNEKGYWGNNPVIEVDPKFFRPAEVNLLIGDSSYARKTLNWQPEYNIDQLIKEMIEYECRCYNKVT